MDHQAINSFMLNISCFDFHSISPISVYFKAFGQVNSNQEMYLGIFTELTYLKDVECSRCDRIHKIYTFPIESPSEQQILESDNYQVYNNWSKMECCGITKTHN